MIVGTCANEGCCPDCCSEVSPDHTLTKGCCQRFVGAPTDGYKPIGSTLAGDVPHDFHAVLSAAALREGRTVFEQLVQFAIDGAEHQRLCRGKK